MLNQVVIIGRLTADPTLSTVGSGIPMTRVRIACDRDYSGKGGERETDFLTVVAWRKTAEFLCKYFKKGSMVAINGRLEARTYTDKNGTKRESVEIVVNDGGVYFADTPKAADGYSKKTNASTSAAPTSIPGGYAAPANSDFAILDDEDDAQLPF